MFVCNSRAAIGVNTLEVMQESKRAEKAKTSCMNKQLEYDQDLSLTRFRALLIQMVFIGLLPARIYIEKFLITKFALNKNSSSPSHCGVQFLSEI